MTSCAVLQDYSEHREGDQHGNMRGEYSVALPDGRIQHVKYTADHYNGYVAEVTYEGTPVYPEAKPYAPAPALRLLAPNHSLSSAGG